MHLFYPCCSRILQARSVSLMNLRASRRIGTPQSISVCQIEVFKAKTFGRSTSNQVNSTPSLLSLTRSKAATFSTTTIARVVAPPSQPRLLAQHHCPGEVRQNADHNSHNFPRPSINTTHSFVFHLLVRLLSHCCASAFWIAATRCSPCAPLDQL